MSSQHSPKRGRPRGDGFFGLFYDYRRNCQRRGIEWDIDRETFTILVQLPCYYCGTTPQTVTRLRRGKEDKGDVTPPHVGLDRVINELGYSLDNVVPCCATCNNTKGTMHLVEFFDHVFRIHSHLVKKFDKSRDADSTESKDAAL